MTCRILCPPAALLLACAAGVLAASDVRGEAAATPGAAAEASAVDPARAGTGAPVSWGLTYEFDGVDFVSGDSPRHLLGSGLLDANLTLDLGALDHGPGGTAFAQVLWRHGPVAGAMSGDLQGFASTDAEPFVRLSEVWYQQTWTGGDLRVKLGQIDANHEFAWVESAAPFYNSSAGFSPTIVGLPSYPDPGLGAVVFARWGARGELGAGVFGGGVDGPADERLARPWWIGEARLDLTGWLTRGRGRLAVGFWRKSGPFARFAGGTASATSGGFAVFEKQVWSEPHPDEGLTIFAQYGCADPDVHGLGRHVALGLVWRGLLPGRGADDAGLYVTRVRPASRPAAGIDASETATELVYALRCSEGVELRPGIQWIRHPGGNSTRPTLAITTVRLAVTF